MRRLLSVAAVAAVSVGLLVPAADAATTPIVSYNGLPSDWYASTIDCNTGGDAAYAPAHVADPAGTPGQGSLKVSSPAGVARDLQFGYGPESLLSQLTAFTSDVYVPSGGAAPEFTIQASEGGASGTPPTHIYALSVKPVGNDAWVSLDATKGLTVRTGTWNAATHDYDWTTAAGTQDLSTFASAHATAWFDSFDISLELNSPADCVASTFYIDNVHYATGSVDNTVDFQVPAQTSLANGSHPAAIVNGQSLTLSATLKRAGTPLAGQTVQLYAKSTGSTTYRLLKTVSTNATTGAASARVAPSNTTSYQWRFPSSGSNQYAPTKASAFTIVSRQRVVVTTKPTIVGYGRTAHIDGYIRPIKGGVTARLIRVVNGKRIVVGYAKTGPKGVFNIYAPMKVCGTYTYLVSALPYPGQDLGWSTTFKITTK